MEERPEAALDDLYREVILEHYRDPHGKAELREPDVVNIGLNPLCGDEMKVALKFEGGRATGVQATGRG